MKKILYTLVIMFLMMNTVKAVTTCDLEEQVQVNNDAGTVNVTAEPFAYEYYTSNSETGEEEKATGYIGMIYINNVTENIYVTITSADDITKKYTYSDAIDDTISINTDEMNVVKTYTVSIYPSNTKCGKSVIRELTVTVPRLNSYYYYDYCTDNPDYMYCQQFTNLENISYNDFYYGVTNYAASKKNQEEEQRKTGIFEGTVSFIRKNWFIVIIVIILIACGSYLVIKNKKEKEREDIV